MQHNKRFEAKQQQQQQPRAVKHSVSPSVGRQL